MIEDKLGVDPRSAVGIDIIAPSDNTGIRDVCRKKVAKPVYLVYGPGLLAMSVEAMDSHNTCGNFS